MFENVNYYFYSEVLRRSVIPDEETFENYKLLNVQKIKSWLPYLEEKEENGIDTAICLMIEIDFKYDESINQKTKSLVSSESVAGHSVSYDNSGISKEIELNAKSIESKKIEVVKLFCYFNLGVRV